MGPYRWPYEPATVDYHAAEGHSWRLSLSADGVRFTHLPRPCAPSTDPADEAPDLVHISAQGAAGELVLVLYGRVPVDSVKVDGEKRILDLLKAWDPNE
ncbi:hypothetical protein OG780_03380 [Streptomyces sp. NBC_00386]|uniref:hypothetical protein n=1 Tax=Streptomyces sp. NBC_00386 TaxID=2975734 RepID=UPI002E24BD80